MSLEGADDLAVDLETSSRISSPSQWYPSGWSGGTQIRPFHQADRANDHPQPIPR